MIQRLFQEYAFSQMTKSSRDMKHALEYMFQIHFKPLWKKIKLHKDQNIK